MVFAITHTITVRKIDNECDSDDDASPIEPDCLRDHMEVNDVGEKLEFSHNSVQWKYVVYESVDVPESEIEEIVKDQRRTIEFCIPSHTGRYYHLDSRFT